MRYATLCLLALIAGCSTKADSAIPPDQKPPVAALRRELAGNHEDVRKVLANGEIHVNPRRGKTTTTFEAEFVLAPGGSVQITPRTEAPNRFAVKGDTGRMQVEVPAGPDEEIWREAGQHVGAVLAWWLDTYVKFFRTSPFDVRDVEIRIAEDHTVYGYRFTVRMPNGDRLQSSVPWHTRRESGFSVTTADAVPLQTVLTSEWKLFENPGWHLYKKLYPQELPWPTRIHIQDEKVSCTITLKTVKLNPPEQPETRP